MLPSQLLQLRTPKGECAYSPPKLVVRQQPPREPVCVAVGLINALAFGTRTSPVKGVLRAGAKAFFPTPKPAPKAPPQPLRWSSQTLPRVVQKETTEQKVEEGEEEDEEQPVPARKRTAARQKLTRKQKEFRQRRKDREFDKAYD